MGVTVSLLQPYRCASHCAHDQGPGGQPPSTIIVGYSEWWRIPGQIPVVELSIYP
jgi:hypothetical protein